MSILQKIMAILIFTLISGEAVFSITNFEINKICRRERPQNECIKRLRLNRDLIKKGKPIKIPVKKYKK